MIYASIFFIFLLAVVLLRISSKQEKAAGMPGGKVIYIDANLWEKVGEPFFDPALGLAGRPDYLVQQNREIIPVEVKSSRVSFGPYDSHIYQLASYCLLVERHFHKRPSYGILHYPTRTYRIDFTQELERSIHELIVEMQARSPYRELHRSHASPARCNACGYRDICEEKLA